MPLSTTLVQLLADVSPASQHCEKTDPETGVVQETLPGVESWGDAVYMRDHAQINHYAFANDKGDGVRNDILDERFSHLTDLQFPSNDLDLPGQIYS